MRWFYSDVTGTSSTAKYYTVNNIVVGPYYYNNILYGTERNLMYQARITKSISGTVFRISPVSGVQYEYNYCRIIGSKDDTDYSSEWGEEIENSVIQGKYKLGSVISGKIISSISIPVDFVVTTVDEVSMNFDSIRTTYDSGTYYTFCGFEFYNCVTTDKISLKSGASNVQSLNIPDQYKNAIIDFGTLPQNIPKTLKDYIELNATQIYEESLTVKSNNGEVTYGTLNQIPEISKCRLSTIGDTKTLNCEGVNGQTYSLSWESPSIIDGKNFVGLSLSVNSKIINIPDGRETTISLSGDSVLYEVYGTSKPILTSFEINLYNNTAESNRIDKTNFINSVGTLVGAMRDASSITDMTIIFESDSIPNFNYVYIPIFNRYYFVNDISTIRYKLWEISITVDALMTYKDGILACSGFIDRNEFASSPYIIDNKRVVKCGNTTSYTVVQNELFVGTEGWYVLNGLGLMSSSVSETNLDEENVGDENAE